MNATPCLHRRRLNRHRPKSSQTESSSTDRRGFLKGAGLGAGLGAVAGASYGKFGLAPITPAAAEPAAPPKLSPDKWWPSKWGADDQAGASNHITPAKVLDSVKWIKDGNIDKLGHDYEASMPLFGKRVFTLRIPGGPTGGPFGENRLVYHDEFVTTEIGQVGTQFRLSRPHRRRHGHARRQGRDAFLQRTHGGGFQ